MLTGFAYLMGQGSVWRDTRGPYHYSPVKPALQIQGHEPGSPAAPDSAQRGHLLALNDNATASHLKILLKIFPLASVEGIWAFC